MKIRIKTFSRFRSSGLKKNPQFSRHAIPDMTDLMTTRLRIEDRSSATMHLKISLALSAQNDDKIT